ncbi:MAG: hypothetical protein V8T36_03035 [Ruthenibacterium lactatiformans]
MPETAPVLPGRLPGTFHLVLLDPPYRHGTVAAMLPAVAAVPAPGGAVLAETERGAPLPEALRRADA